MPYDNNHTYQSFTSAGNSEYYIQEVRSDDDGAYHPVYYNGSYYDERGVLIWNPAEDEVEKKNTEEYFRRLYTIGEEDVDRKKRTCRICNIM